MLGMVYERIANFCLLVRYPYLKTNDRHAILERGGLEEVDKMAHAVAHIRVGVEALSKDLDDLGCSLPEDFEEIMLCSSKPRSALREYVDNVITPRGFDDIAKAKFACDMMIPQHGLWIEQYSQYFCDRFEEEKYLYMPAEFVGYERFMGYYPYVAEILGTIELRTNPKFVQLVYMNMQENTFRREGIKTKDDLRKYIDNYEGDSSPISRLRLSENLMSINTIVNEISSRNSCFLSA